MIIRFNFLMFCVGLALGAPVFAAEPNSSPSPGSATSDTVTQNLANGYLQIQAQLHDTQLAIEDSRRTAAAEAATNTAVLTGRLRSLEEIVAAQRAKEAETAEKNQQVTMMLAGAFGLTVLAAVLFMAWLQWRAVSRLVELAAVRQSEFLPGGAAPSLVTGAAVEQSNARLFGAVDHLQKRILELEQISRGVLAEKTSSATTTVPPITELKNGNSTSSDREECVVNLIAEGQSLLDTHDPEKALECFEIALGLDPKHIDALVKKGGALEKLGRTDEAIVCYDRAIEANNSATIAYLQKGGLFNRLARYDEALQCYEQALRTQEKNSTATKVS